MNIIEIRGPFVNHFILYDEKDTVILDTGLFRGVGTVRKELEKINRTFEDVTAIFLTHGHFDHVTHLPRLKKLTNAPVYCSLKEQIHIDGKYPYKGWNRVTGALEALGRLAFRYQAIPIDVHVKEGDILDFFGGMEVFFLPGHSIGHLGYLHRNSKYLFVIISNHGPKLSAEEQLERYNIFFEKYYSSSQS